MLHLAHIARRCAPIRIAGLALMSLLVLSACGPISPERAAKLCEDRARAATGPTGNVGIGIGTDGPSGFASISVTSDYLQGRDPYVVYEDCVQQKTGAPPIRPLDLGE